MANKWQVIGLALIITVAFFAGGWFFSHTSQRDIKHEIEGLYQKDGTSIGIFDRVSEEDMVAAEQIAAESLHASSEALPEDVSQYLSPSEQELTTQLTLTPRGDIASVAPQKTSSNPQEQKDRTDTLLTRPVVQLNGDEKTALVVQTVPETEDSHITMIVAPVRLLLVRNLDEYKAFKQRARGGYPTVDFAKQMVIVLESDSNFPDKVFEIVSADKQDGALVVSYRVNVLGLDKKINSHAVLPVDKTQLPVQLKQVL